MKMNTEITNNKRIGAAFAILTALFALTLIVMPAKVAFAGGEDNDYSDYGGYDWGGGSDYGYSDYGGYDWNDYGGTGSYGSTGYQDYYENTPYYSYTTPSGGSSYYQTPSYQYSTPSYYGGSSYVPYQPMTYQQYPQSSPNYNTNANSNYNQQSQGQSQSSTNNNTNKNNSTSVSSSNSSATANNNLTNNNSNNSNNTNNSINNNNISLVVYAAGATSTYSNTSDNNPQLNGYCIINPNTVAVGQDANFMAYPSGGTGYYTYSWSGTDGISSDSQNFTGRFGIPGTKNAYVSIHSGNQTITRSCSVTVVQNYNYNYTQPTYPNNVTVYRQPTQTTQSGVYLSQVPATGISFNMKTGLFAAGLLIWSAFVAFIMIVRRKAKLANVSELTKEEAFKLANMKRQGIAA